MTAGLWVAAILVYVLGAEVTVVTIERSPQLRRRWRARSRLARGVLALLWPVVVVIAAIAFRRSEARG